MMPLPGLFLAFATPAQGLEPCLTELRFMTHLTDRRPARLFFCWHSRLGALSLVVLAATWTLDALAPTLI
jgi:hypothetical protein